MAADDFADYWGFDFMDDGDNFDAVSSRDDQTGELRIIHELAEGYPDMCRELQTIRSEVIGFCRIGAHHVGPHVYVDPEPFLKYRRDNPRK